jgi:hypothetical protein
MFVRAAAERRRAVSIKLGRRFLVSVFRNASLGLLTKGYSAFRELAIRGVSPLIFLGREEQYMKPA